MIFKTFRDNIRDDNTIAKVLNRRSLGVCGSVLIVLVFDS